MHICKSKEWLLKKENKLIILKFYKYVYFVNVSKNFLIFVPIFPKKANKNKKIIWLKKTQNNSV